jgi:hypothetical protein
LTCQFIDTHKDRFGVAPICRVLSQHSVPIAARDYWARRSRRPPRRSVRDQALTEILAGIHQPGDNGRRQPESLYGTITYVPCTAAGSATPPCASTPSPDWSPAANAR